jgi:WD40 repeat protein
MISKIVENGPGQNLL